MGDGTQKTPSSQTAGKGSPPAAGKGGTHPEEIRALVAERYGAIAKGALSCCGASCCTNLTGIRAGYTGGELEKVPKDADLGLGCGNPTATASLRPGDVVVDLGSGAGIDCFLASDKVGASGRVIGVDMTPEMIERARKNALEAGYTNVEFRLGTIENLPVDDMSADVVISNCVVNLSPDKHAVFREAFRVLKPGGRLVVSDIVLVGELPDQIRSSPEAYVACIAGAVGLEEYLDAVRAAGFVSVEVERMTTFPLVDAGGADGASDIIASVTVKATRP